MKNIFFEYSGLTMELEIEIEEVENTFVLRLNGRLDVATTPLLEQRITVLLKEKGSKILLDFTDLEYISSGGIRLLLSMTKKLEEQKGALVIYSLIEDVLAIIKMAGLERIFHIFANEQDALRYVSQV